MARVNPYNTGLDKNAANYTPLSPLSLIARSAYVYPRRTAVIYGERRLTWSQVYTRCRRLASSLIRHGRLAGETVSAMLPSIVRHALGNSPQASPTQRHYQRHFSPDRHDDMMGKTDTRPQHSRVGYRQDRKDMISVSPACGTDLYTHGIA